MSSPTICSPTLAPVFSGKILKQVQDDIFIVPADIFVVQDDIFVVPADIIVRMTLG